MAANPYRPNVARKSVPIVYAGVSGGFHAFRLRLEGVDPMVTVMMRRDIADWLFEAPAGAWHMGNGFEKGHPGDSLLNDGYVDLFVLLERLSDVARFEAVFPVQGYTPTLVA